MMEKRQVYAVVKGDPAAMDAEPRRAVSHLHLTPGERGAGLAAYSNVTGFMNPAHMLSLN